MQFEVPVSLGCQLHIVAAGLTNPFDIAFEHPRYVPVTLDAEVGDAADSSDHGNELNNFERRQVGAKREDVLVPLEAVIGR